ncbi:MAG: gamma-glutamyltransferase, partial [Acidobacteria bacterium]|nr:gamma-glutamyltransferase [Acidobacteriota bacterium]
MKFISILILIFLTAHFTADSSLDAYDRITGNISVSRSEVIATEGMVASSHPLATQIGLDILKKGGSAVDAAIAIDAALGLMEPTGAGIGGDLFAIVWDNKTGKLYGLNASGPAPKKLNVQHFRDNNLSRVPYYGVLPWTVPGCVDGWFKLHSRFGKLPLKDILSPAIGYAEKGFPMTELIGYYWDISVRRFKEYENFQKLYAPGGKAPAKGEIFKNPELAATYRLIADKGRDAYYKGKIAETIVAYSKRVGGFFEMEDFTGFESEWVEPLSVSYRGYDVWELPPNGQGIAALQMLQMLEEYDLSKMTHNSSEYLHLLIEIKKIVFEDRARFYADPKFNQIPIKELISKEYAKKRLTLFNPNRAAREYPNGSEILEHGDTVYLTVV